MKKKAIIPIHYSFLRFFAASYILCPVVIFLIGFVKWYWAIPGVCAIGYSLYKIINNSRGNLINEIPIDIPFRTIAGIFLFMLLWTFLGGMNGFWYQSSDYSVRNAVLRDLTTHSWPVIYQNGNTALVYYIGHWLPAAVIGKISYAIFHSMQFTWLSARIALWVWSSIGLTILSLLLIFHVQADNRKKRIMAILIMVFFSGMDIVGTLLEQKLAYNLSADVLHLEWWSPKYWQYSSITTCLYWVFNQAITPWIVTLLILIDPEPRYYILYISACMISAPMPAVGLSFVIIGKEIPALVNAIRTHNITARLKSIFSVSNMLMLLTCIPIMVFYLLCSSTTGDIEAKTTITGNSSIIRTMIQFGIFYILEAGIILIVLWPDYKKDPLFYTVGLSLLIMPFIRVGQGTDFCMRGSIPAVFLLMVFSVKRLMATTRDGIKEKSIFQRRYLTIALIIILTVGAVTPAVEIYRGFYNVISKGNVKLTSDDLYSFENEANSYNFTTPEYKHTLFFSVYAQNP